VRVLVSAYACEPGKGSEPGVGWNWVCQIAKFHDVWVITRANNIQPIKAELARKPMPNVRWIFFDLPPWARFWKNKRRGIHLYYYLWQIGAYWRARRLHRNIGFDLVHHVTFVKFCTPSFMALLPVPFIWGPVGGADSTPRRFWFSLSPRGKLYELARYVAVNLARFDPVLRLTWWRTTLALATTNATRQRIRNLGCGQVLLYPEAGLRQVEIESLGRISSRSADTFRLLSAGTLLHLKGFDLGLRAFAVFREQFPGSEYWLIGEGAERGRLEQLAQELGLTGQVSFLGALPRFQVLERLAECDVLLHPALHESGGWVCLEAMAAGRPVVCLDLAGTALQVTESTGIKVAALSPAQAVRDMASALVQLASDPVLCARLGQEGRRRVAEQFNWNRKGDFLAELYTKLTDGRGDVAIESFRRHPSSRSTQAS